MCACLSPTHKPTLSDRANTMERIATIMFYFKCQHIINEPHTLISSCQHLLICLHPCTDKTSQFDDWIIVRRFVLASFSIYINQFAFDWI